MKTLTLKPSEVKLALQQHWQTNVVEGAPVFKQLMINHIKTQWIAYALLTALLLILNHHYTFSLNASQSLPYSVYVIKRNEPVGRGDIVAFRWHGGGPWITGVTFGKRVVGIPGDTVTRVDRQFFVNGKPVGLAKTHSLRNVPLEVGPVGELPANKYYVAADHPDSLDSRYALAGWIDRSVFVGKVIWAW
jgi:conjugal transfer pilin signal peptidase TrbI